MDLPAPGLRARFLAFIVERHPLAFEGVRAALHDLDEPESRKPDAIRAYGRKIVTVLAGIVPDAAGVPDPVPRLAADARIARARRGFLEDVDGFFARSSIAASLTREERLEILRGMVLTRAVDNRLKRFFTSGEVTHRGTPFQGKGFRSLGQEAIYAAGIRLRRGEQYRSSDGSWGGDVVGPLIRDLGVALAMRPDAATVQMVLNAQMGKSGPPMDGRDLHIGDFSHGILPATAPLTISTLTLAGLAFAFRREASGRVALSFVGDGGTSLGEWHEAINAAAVHTLPMIFCVENNQVALSSPVPVNSVARTFADKAAGYGIPGVAIDGTDADDVAGAFAWAVERARDGRGPTLIELISMRMCGHAHHDDMLYLGREAPPGWTYGDVAPGAGYVDREAYSYWSAHDPLVRYAGRLEQDGLLAAGELDRLQSEAEEMVDTCARAVVDAPWPDSSVARVTTHDGEAAARRDPLAAADPAASPSLRVTPGLPFDRDGCTFLEAIALGIGDALRADPRVFVYGEDVGAPYGNAFRMLQPLLSEFGDRIVDSPLAEGAVLGICTGAALGGLRPIGEMQFNDFVATGFNQVVNNAAKIHARWRGTVPMVVRMPWGGLRHAGPYHSQNTEAWFYRTPGLKIVVPSTPEDARALMASAVADPDPVLFYEHMALYRDPRIRQRLPDEPPAPLPSGQAALRRHGDDLAIISYGAYVHVALRVAARLEGSGIQASVLDLRWLAPLDRHAVLTMARRCSRVLIVHEDTRTGGIGESLAAIIQEEAFQWLDAPVRIIGALDTPVPYSPPLEEAFLPSEDEIFEAAVRLCRY